MSALRGCRQSSAFLESREYILRELIDLSIEELRSNRCLGVIDARREFDSALAIFSCSLGTGYIKPKDVAEMLDGRTASLRVARDEDGKIIGATLLKVLSKKDCAAFDQDIAPKRIGVALTEQPKVGYLQSLAVANAVRGRGVGSRLVLDAVTHLQAWGCTSAFTVSWRPSNGQPHSGGVFRAAGFSEVATVEDYWADSSRSESFLCPSCGKPPCRCSAVFMIRQEFQ